MRANEGICSDGIKFHGKGFVVSSAQAKPLGLEKRQGLENHIRPYRNGRDLAGTSRGMMAIDLFGLGADEVRQRFPEVYQYLLQSVKPERDLNRRDTYREQWWIFGEPRREIRPALAEVSRYIATVDTSEHRIFQFLDASILCDDGVVIVASDDAYLLGVLHSRVHLVWALATGGWLGVGNDLRWNKTKVFDPFPFPVCADALKAEIRAVAEELDAHRKARQSEHPRLTLTQMYNVLEKLRAAPRAGSDPAGLTPCRDRRWSLGSDPQGLPDDSVRACFTPRIRRVGQGTVCERVGGWDKASAHQSPLLFS